MNKAILMGRLTRDPEVRYTEGDNSIAIARYILAIDRPKSSNNENPGADFPSCVAFGKNGEFAEKYLRKGTKILIEGQIMTGSYTNKDGNKVYTTEIKVDHQEFAESKGSSNREARDQSSLTAAGLNEQTTDGSGFMNIPEGIEEELPFN